MPHKPPIVPGHELRGINVSDYADGFVWVCECGTRAGDYQTDDAAAIGHHRHAKGFNPDFRGPA